MKPDAIRNFLGIFYLGITAVLGGYIIILKETIALPISQTDANSAFQIIIPTFVAQLTAIFRWIANPQRRDNITIAIPKWAIFGPPLATLIVLVTALALIIWDQGKELESGVIFKNAVTFCVTLLGASTVFIVSLVFSEPKKEDDKPSDKDD